MKRFIEQTTTSLEPTKGPGFAGNTWLVTIIGAKNPGEVVQADGREYVRSLNGRLYSCDGLKASTSMWNGVKVYDNHLTDSEFDAKAGMRSVPGEWLGSIVDPFWEAQSRRLRGTLKIVDANTAAKLKAAYDQGLLGRGAPTGTIGLSIDTMPDGREGTHEGQSMSFIEGFKKIYSVDLVAEPAAGGSFDKLVESLHSHRPADLKAVGTSTRSKEEMPKGATPPSEPGLEITPEFEAYLKDLIAEALGEQGTTKPEDEVPPEEEVPPKGEAVQPEGAWVAESVLLETAERAEKAEAALTKVDELEARFQIRETLGRAKLSDQGLRLVESAVAGWTAFDKKEFDNLVAQVKKSDARRDPTGRVSEGGRVRGSGISVGMNERDKAEVEFMRLVAGNVGLREIEANKAYYVQERFTPSFKSWVRSGRPDYRTRKLSEWAYNLLGGDPISDSRAFEAVTTSGMSSIVKNTLNLILAANYSQKDEWWAPIVKTEEVDTLDDATLVRVFGLSNLSQVDEGAPYTELEWADEEETASFRKRGNYVGVTMETLMRDKLNVVRSIPDRLANAWWNTLSTMVSNVFTLNGAAGPVLADAGALFNAAAATAAGGHANLLTTALSFAAYGAAKTAMLKQTDRQLGVGRRLMIEPKYLLLPVDLETTGLQILNSEYRPDAGAAAAAQPADVNPYKGTFDIVKVPEWTDTSDWALVADPAKWPAIWMIFLKGKRTPELFTSDAETTGAMFTNDTLRFKVRMLSFRYSSTYDCAPVADFRPLHKNNV